MKTSGLLAIVSILLLGSSCATYKANRVDTQVHPIKCICIKENPRVRVGDFLHAMENGFDSHGIVTEIHDGPLPATCKYSATYTALQAWDFTLYLKYAEIRLKHGRDTIGFASYRQRGGSASLALNKWKNTESVVDRLIDGLLPR
ncbi:MAG: hypothetical protein GY849_22760 [Deltaproteobacteria bacterium]|nr:hypothetical protein [Deltaproteobacteria bacterium]